MKSNHRVHLTGFAVLLCAGLAAWLTMRSAVEIGDIAGSDIPLRGDPRQIGGEDCSAPVAGSFRQRDARPQSPRYEHTSMHLVDFVVADVEGRDVTLRAAVNLLVSAYKDACRLSRTEPIDFDFAFPESAARISFSIERAGFLAALHHIAALAGHEVERNGEYVTFREIASGPDAGAAPTVLNALDASRIREIAGRLGSDRPSDMRSILRLLGIEVEAVERAPTGGEFTIRNASPLARKQIETLLGALNVPQKMVARMKLIHATGGLPLGSPYLDSVETAEWLQTAVERSANITTLPSATLRNGMDSAMEIIKEVELGNWTGTKIDLVVEPIGLAMVSRDTVRVRPEDSPGVRLQHTSRAALLDGDSHVTVLGEHEGATIYRMLSLEKITATGEPWRNVNGPPAGGYPVAEAVVGHDGMVRSPYNNHIVDVRDIPSGTLVADPTAPMADRKFFRVP